MKERVLEVAKAHLGGLVLRTVRPLRDRSGDWKGTCNVCGTVGRFAFNSWVVPREIFGSDDYGDVRRSYEVRESMLCRVCSSNERVRRISQCLLGIYGNGQDGTIDQLFRRDSFRLLDVAEINAIGSLGSLHTYLNKLPRLTFSQYRSDAPLGSVVDGIRNEDMCNLTYADSSFDLVLSSDTLEHVPDYAAALSEVYRILRPGGRLILTVPVDGKLAKTKTRARVNSDGSIQHLDEPVYHGRGRGLLRLVPVGEDMLAFTDFGADTSTVLEQIGFRVDTFRDGNDPSGASWVFSALVPSDADA